MYGRLRRIAEVTVGKVGRFVSVGGVPAVRGWMNPFLQEPFGLRVPVDESAPTVGDPGEDEKGYRAARTEEVVFEHHPDAAHFRYPYAYGPYQVVPREWMVVRRILDRTATDGGGRRRPAPSTTTGRRTSPTPCCSASINPTPPRARCSTPRTSEVLTVRQVIELSAAARATSSKSSRCPAAGGVATPAAHATVADPVACSISHD